MKHNRSKKCKKCGKKIFGKSSLCPGCYKDQFDDNLRVFTDVEAN